MTRPIHILLLLLLVVSCTKEHGHDTSSNIPITFSADTEISTRGTSLESMKGQSFGVIGYKYEKGWDSEEAMAKPDPNWYNKRVTCANTGECAYDGLQMWDYKYQYSFFAYFPHSPKGTIKLSSAETTKAPVLTYTMPAAARTDITAMEDLMYAYKIDANVKNSTKVNLHFKHCLSALHVVAENFNDAPIEISNLSVKILIQYDQAIFPLNGGKMTPLRAIINDGSDQTTTAEYRLIEGNRTIPSTRDKPYEDISNGQHILIIPQTGTNVILTYTDKEGRQASTKPINFPKELMAGKRYLISLQFVGETTNVLIIEADSWTDHPTDIEFE